MEKVGGLHLGNHDIFINVAGGVKLDEPAVDLGIVSSIMSSFLDRPIDAGTVVCGEIGLTGEVRGIGQVPSRVREASRMGFTRCVLPRAASLEIPDPGITLLPISNIRELQESLF